MGDVYQAIWSVLRVANSTNTTPPHPMPAPMRKDSVILRIQRTQSQLKRSGQIGRTVFIRQRERLFLRQTELPAFLIVRDIFGPGGPAPSRFRTERRAGPLFHSISVFGRRTAG